jgi:hypothetical protein
MSNQSKPPPELDLVWGIVAIGNVLGLTERQTLHLAGKDVLPIMKVAGRYCASRSGLRKHFAAILGDSDVSPQT